MKKLIGIFAAATLLFGAVSIPQPAAAIGCLSGGALGAVGGHVAGGHGVLGAVGGCVAGHYMAKKQARDQAESERQYNHGYQNGNQDWHNQSGNPQGQYYNPYKQ